MNEAYRALLTDLQLSQDDFVTAIVSEVCANNTVQSALSPEAGASGITSNGEDNITSKLQLLLREEERSWLEWRDSVVSGWSPFRSVEVQGTNLEQVVSNLGEVDSNVHAKRPHVPSILRAISEGGPRHTTSQPAVTFHRTASEGRVPSILTFDCCMNSEFSHQVRNLTDLKWIKRNVMKQSERADKVHCTAIQCHRLALSANDSESFQRRLLQSTLSSWMRYVVASLTKSTATTVAALQILKGSFTAWLMQVMASVDKSLACTVAAAQTKRSCFNAWHIHVVEYEMCLQQYHRRLLLRCLRRFAVCVDKSLAFTVAAVQTKRSCFNAWHVHVVEYEMCLQQYRRRLLLRCLRRFAVYTAVSNAINKLVENQRRRVLFECLLYWVYQVIHQSAVIPDAIDAKETCLRELSIYSRINDLMHRNYKLSLCRHAVRKWFWGTYTLKDEVAYGLMRFNSLARSLCAWVLSKMLTDNARVPRMVDDFSQTMSEISLCEQRLHSQNTPMSRRRPDPARCAPFCPRLFRSSWRPPNSIGVWQELLCELRMATVKVDSGTSRTGCPSVQMLRPVPVGSRRFCAIGASVLRARISLASLEQEDILAGIDSD